MQRYLVERTFPDCLDIPQDATGAEMVRTVADNNAVEGVTWVHSYVSADRTRTYCIYDGPTPEAIRAVAAKNGLPVDGITAVSVLDPYFYRSSDEG